jgi:CBS domain-containing protein
MDFSQLPLPCEQVASLKRGIRQLDKLADAPALFAEIACYSRQLLVLGLAGDLVAQTHSIFNDALTKRVIELTAQRHRLPSVEWCWLALGSEGRHEQTFVSDQDNALIFSASDAQEGEALRELFLPFARDVNQQLAACGFKLCPGEIMAGNPAWCLSLDEWRRQFQDWVRRPEPTALLNASIFFDLRPLYGDASLAERLRTLLLSMTTDTSAFLHLMAANALQAQAPLGFLGEVVVEKGAALEAIDLKKFGSRIFVDAARIFALAHGVRRVNTQERLRAAGPLAGLGPEEMAAVDAAFTHILRLRMQTQLQEAQAEWHEIDRLILRESLKQARRLQQRLKLNYGL